MHELWTSHLHPPQTGAGLAQHRIVDGLRQRGFEVHTSSQPDRFATSAPVRAGGLLRENVDAIRHRQVRALVFATPAPLLPPVDFVLLVHDLRWMHTRGNVARAYRSWDLRRSASAARAVVTALPDVASEVMAVVGRPVEVVPFGCGRATNWKFNEHGNGDVVLVGAAPHKQNEAAARLLLRYNSWFRRVVTLNVSPTTQQILAAGLPNERVEHHGALDDGVFQQILESSSYFVHLGTSEGFGFTYLEALSAGCCVIAADYPVARSVLGTAGLYCAEDRSATFRHLDEGSVVSPTESARRAQIKRFDWERCIDAFADIIDRPA